MFFSLDQFDECDVFGELCDIIGPEEDDDIVFGALEAILMIIFDEERVEAALAVGVAAGREQARHVVAAVLTVAERALQVAFH